MVPTPVHPVSSPMTLSTPCFLFKTEDEGHRVQYEYETAINPKISTLVYGRIRPVTTVPVHALSLPPTPCCESCTTPLSNPLNLAFSGFADSPTPSSPCYVLYKSSASRYIFAVIVHSSTSQDDICTLHQHRPSLHRGSFQHPPFPRIPTSLFLPWVLPFTSRLLPTNLSRRYWILLIPILHIPSPVAASYVSVTYAVLYSTLLYFTWSFHLL